MDMNDKNVLPDLSQIATTLDGRDITRGYLGPLLIPQDRVLLSVGGNLMFYEEVLTDDQVASTFQQRQLALVSVPWEVTPGGTSRQDKKAADFLSAQLESIGFDNLTKKMLYGMFYGYSVGECLYARDGAQVVLDGIKVRKSRRFRFAPDESLRLLTMQNMWDGEVLPPRKFWTYQCGADNDDEPYGLGLAHWLYWPVFFKKNGVTLWLKYLDKFAQPTTVGKYPRGTSQPEINTLLQALQAINTDTGIAVPTGVTLELLEAARSGTGDYATIYDRMNQAIAKVVLGQMMTSEAVGGHNKADVQMQVRQDLVKADADMICSSFMRGPGKWLTEWNFPGAATPRLRRIIEEPEDLKARAERDASLYSMGYRPKLRYVQDTYGGEWEDVGAPKPGAPEAPKPDNPAFAENTPDDEINALEQEMLSDWEKVTSPLVQPIVDLAASCESFEAFQEALPGLIGKMDVSMLVEQLAQGSFAANLWGRLNPGPGGE